MALAGVRRKRIKSQTPRRKPCLYPRCARSRGSGPWQPFAQTFAFKRERRCGHAAPTVSKPSARAFCLISSTRKSIISHLARKKDLAVIGRQRFVGEHWWEKYPPLDLGFGKISFVNHFRLEPSRFQ